MLPKPYRLSSKYEINKTKKHGSVFHGNFVILIYLPVEETKKLTAIVSRKFSNKAVDRNRVKRRIRAVLKENLGNLKCGFYLFIPKKHINDASYQQLSTDINKVISEVLKF